MYHNHFYHRVLTLITALLIFSIVLSPPLSAGTLSAPNHSIHTQDAQPESSENQESKGTVAVGSRDFTEQLLLGQIIIVLLEEAGYEVIDRTGLGGTNSTHDAIKAGEVDIIWEYIGTILSESHDIPPSGLPADTATALDIVAALDSLHHDLVWLTPSAFNDTYTFMVRSDDPALADLQSFEDLPALLATNNSLRLCVENEFYSRGDGLFNLQKHYGFEFPEANIEIVAYDQLYEGLREGLCDIAEGFSTDGRISAWNFRNLEDSQQFFPAYNASPIVRADILAQYPEIGELLNTLGERLDNETIAALNARIDLGPDGIAASGDEETPKEVAISFLKSIGMLNASPITIGSKDYTEQLILGYVLKLLLEDAGYAVNDKIGIGGSRVVREAILSSEIDLYMELTGTALAVHNGLPASALPSEADRAYALAKSLDEPRGIIWLDRGEFNNTYAMMVRDDLVSQGIESIDDLAAYMVENDSSLTICVENDFYGRPFDGLLAMQEHYGFEFKPENVLLMDLDSTYESLREGDCDVAEGFATDGRIGAWNLTNLEDSRTFFPFYNIAPIIRREVLDANPNLADLFNAFPKYLDDATMRQLNARVDLGADGLVDSGDEETPEDVAFSFLRSVDLLRPPPVTVASKDYTEQLILGQILRHLLEDAGFPVNDKTGFGGSRVVREAILSGEIDLYMELTGTALAVYNGLPASALPSEADRAYALAKSLDEAKGIIWLDRGEFNNTYAMMVRDDLVSQGIESIDDLAAYMVENDSPLTICVENDFYGRPFDGLLAMQERYGFEFKPENVILSDLDSVYYSLMEGDCDVAEGYATDGRIPAWGFTNLEDSQGFFPFYNIAPVVRKELLDANPELIDLFNSFPQYLDDATMSQLNARVDLGADGLVDSGDEEIPSEVALSFLQEIGLLETASTEATEDTDSTGDNVDSTSSEVAVPVVETESSSTDNAETDAPETESSDTNAADGAPTAADTPPADATPAPDDITGEGTEDAQLSGSELLTDTVPQVVVGTTEDTQHRLVGQMLLLMLHDAGYEAIDQTGLGDSLAVRSAMTAEDVDVAVETAANALTQYHKLPASALPEDSARAYALASQLDAPQGIAWLKPTTAHSGMALIVQQALADDGIATIDDLADYLVDSDTPLTLCADEAFLTDSFGGLSGLQRVYGIDFSPDAILTLEANEVYAALHDADCDVAVGAQGDGHINAWSFYALTDTKAFFSTSPLVPIIRQEMLNDVPALDTLLGQLGDYLDDEVMGDLSTRVEIGADGQLDSGDEEDVQAAANDFLCANDLLTDCPVDSAQTAPTDSTDDSATDDASAQEDDAPDSTAPASDGASESDGAQDSNPDSASDSTQDSDSTPESGGTENGGTVAESNVSQEASAEEEAIIAENADNAEGGDTTENTPEIDAVAEDSASTETSSDTSPLITPQQSIQVKIPENFGVNARATTSTEADISAVLPRGAALTALARTADGDWLQIQLPNGSQAWVYASAVISTPEEIEQLPVVQPPALGESP